MPSPFAADLHPVLPHTNGAMGQELPSKIITLLNLI